MSNTERLYKILDSQISKKSVNLDFDINIGLTNTNRPIPLNETNSVVDQSQVFEDERTESTCYRFLGSIRQVMSNVLFNITGIDSEDTIQAFLTTPDPKYSTINQVLIEKDGWFGYFSESGTNLCNFVELYPKETDLSIVKDGVSDNWVMRLTYPYTGVSNTVYFNANEDPLHPIYLTNGLAISSVFSAIVGGVTMTGFKSPINHGLNMGDQVRITGGTNYDGIYSVAELGDQTGDNDNYNFIINTIRTGSTSAITFTNASFRRVVNGVDSKYYGRYFSAITQTNQIDYYPASFSNTIFNDNVIAINSKNDIDLSLYKDYLGRPITEVYLTLVKNKTSSIFWGDMRCGLETKVILANYDIRQINNVNPIPDLGLVNSTNNVFFGDIIDYNDEDISERILETARHRFNTINRETNQYYEGYFYKPHSKIVIQYYSNQVEYSDPSLTTVNIPYYALYSNGRYRWRDILTKGYFDETGRGVNYPFLNGCNYTYDNFFLSVRRQDPTLDYNHVNNSIIGLPCDDSVTQFKTIIKDVC
jgi:hypothetical protein